MIKLIHGDCATELLTLKPDSIDLTLTSPPYDSLRKYEDSLIWNSSKWKKIIILLYRATKPGGVVIWVVGDATIDGGETLTSFRQAIFAQECGFRVHDTMIYQKHNFSNPSSNRYHQIFEYMFVFSKGKPKTFNPIKDRKNVEAGKIGSWGKNTVRQPDGTFKENKRKINTEYGQRYNIWRIVTHNKKAEHPAQFPEELVNDQIISWSNPGKDTVILDPMMGSGTTGKVAKKLGRSFIGIEKVKKYFDMSERKINE